MKHIEIFTDGACRGNPGPGGWGALLRYQGTEKELFGGEQDTTNNRMEMQAAIEGLRALSSRCTVTLTTDSVYVQKGITQWLAGWKKKNWVKKDKKPVKNIDVWKRLEIAAGGHTIDWQWVKGHAGHEMNERCDELATEAADGLRGKLIVDEGFSKSE